MAFTIKQKNMKKIDKKFNKILKDINPFTKLNNISSTQEDLEPLFANNFVDIMIDPVMSLKAPLNILTDILQSQRSLKFHPYDPDQANSLSQQIIDIEGRQFNVLDFIKEYIENLEHDRDTKDKMYQSLVKLHTIVTTQEQENK
jgi:hypothetical protein